MIETILNERYQLEAELGTGGMGTIYRAHDRLLNRDVAVKLLNKSGLGTEGRAHLLHEAQAAARLNHPNIVTIYDAGEAESVPYIVMELVPGEDLTARMPDTLEKQLSTARQICSALEHAHSHGIIHRDLKPENVLVLADGTVKLTDFGLARSVTSRITSDGLIVGTPFYISPEVALRREVDGRADLYSLGVMMYEMTTGQLPFTADDPLAVISQHLYSPVVPPRARNPKIPSGLDALIVQLLSKQPSDRPASAGDTRQMLELLENVNRLNLGSSPELDLPVLNRLARGRLVGRELELEKAKALWMRAIQGEGDSLLITGEPGIGKTRLANELAARIAVTGGRVVSGTCYAEGGVPYAPFAHMIRESLRQYGSSLNLPDFILHDLSAIAPDLGSGSGRKSGFDAATEQQQLFESAGEWVTALSQQAPLMLFVDDIHWADSGTLYMLRSLARQASSLRLLIVMTYREVELVESSPLHTVLHDFSRERLADRIKLSRFTLEQTREMLTSLLQAMEPVDDSLVESIHHETEGNPFFIEEVTKELIEQGKLCYEEVCWVPKMVDQIEIPQSVRLTIQSRLARLPEPTQEVLRVAAFLGRDFEVNTLQAALDLPEDDVIEAIENAERAQIIEEVSGQSRFSSLTYSFAHALIPSTLRDRTSTIRQQRMHRKVAAAIEATHPNDGLFFEVLAKHYELAGDAENALENLRKAGRRSLEVFANQEAENQFLAALDLVETGIGKAELHEGLAEALFRQSRFDEADNHFQKALEIFQNAGDADKTAFLITRRARSNWFLHELDRSLAICQEGFEELRKMGIDPEKTESPGIAALLHETARAYRFTGQPEQALELCRRAVEMSEKLGQVDVLADSLATLGILPNISREEARQVLERSVALADKHSLLLTAIRGHINLGETYRSTGMLAPALDQIWKARENSHRIGMKIWETDVLVTIIDILLDMGQLQKALQELYNLMILIREYPENNPNRLWAYTIEAKYYQCAGDWETALQKYSNCRKIAADSQYSKYLISTAKNHAEALLHAGQLEESEKLLADVLLASHDELEFDQYVSHLLLAVIHARTGRAASAQQTLDTLLTQQPADHNWVFQPMIQWVTAEICAAEGRWDEASAAFHAAGDENAQAGASWWHAYYIYEHASALQRSGRPEFLEEASGLYSQALDMFDKMQAEGYVNLLRSKVESVKAN